ncbi:hypothetical protein SCYAM73S_02868 [Streptomyces cyaneofuscatus]
MAQGEKGQGDLVSRRRVSRRLLLPAPGCGDTAPGKGSGGRRRCPPSCGHRARRTARLRRSCWNQAPTPDATGKTAVTMGGAQDNFQGRTCRRAVCEATVNSREVLPWRKCYDGNSCARRHRRRDSYGPAGGRAPGLARAQGCRRGDPPLAVRGRVHRLRGRGRPLAGRRREGPRPGDRRRRGAVPACTTPPTTARSSPTCAAGPPTVSASRTSWTRCSPSSPRGTGPTGSSTSSSSRCTRRTATPTAISKRSSSRWSGPNGSPSWRPPATTTRSSAASPSRTSPPATTPIPRCSSRRPSPCARPPSA